MLIAKRSKDELIEGGFNNFELSTREVIIFSVGLLAGEVRRLKKLGLWIVFKKRKLRPPRTLH